MNGSMRQRGSAWELRVYLGADPVSGKQRDATRTVGAGTREAQRVLNEMKVEAERGLAARTTATVGELLDRWLESPRPRGPQDACWPPEPLALLRSLDRE